MKLLLLLFQSLFCLFIMSNFLHADPGTTYIFSPPLQNQIEGTQATAYNAINNQFIFAWLDGQSGLDCVICNADGSQASSQVVITPPFTSSSQPCVSYNSTDNQYIVAWNVGTIAVNFSILDAQGNTLVGPVTISLSPNLVIDGNIYSCYNSTNNQYCLTWTAQNTITNMSNTYFALVNADGTIAQDEIEIPNPAGQVTSDFTDSFVSYNAINNQYFFTWQANTTSGTATLFAIYNADGSVAKSGTLIPQAINVTTVSQPIYSCFNTQNDTYFLAWTSNTLSGLGISDYVYDSAGNQISSLTLPVNLSYYFEPVISFNSDSNQYCMSFNYNSNAICYIFDAQGNVIESDINVPLLPEGAPASAVVNSYNAKDNTYFLTWYAADMTTAYYNIFNGTVNPPTQLTGTRTLNRFVNYGEYVITLNWAPTTSSNVAGYNIYRNGIVLTTVASQVTSYVLHNQPSHNTTYAVQTVTLTGELSSLINISL